MLTSGRPLGETVRPGRTDLDHRWLLLSDWGKLDGVRPGSARDPPHIYCWCGRCHVFVASGQLASLNDAHTTYSRACTCKEQSRRAHARLLTVAASEEGRGEVCAALTVEVCAWLCTRQFQFWGSQQ